jgi:hypothetical protein
MWVRVTWAQFVRNFDFTLDTVLAMRPAMPQPCFLTKVPRFIYPFDCAITSASRCGLGSDEIGEP